MKLVIKIQVWTTFHETVTWSHLGTGHHNLIIASHKLLSEYESIYIWNLPLTFAFETCTIHLYIINGITPLANDFKRQDKRLKRVTKTQLLSLLYGNSHFFSIYIFFFDTSSHKFDLFNHVDKRWVKLSLKCLNLWEIFMLLLKLFLPHLVCKTVR